MAPRLAIRRIPSNVLTEPAPSYVKARALPLCVRMAPRRHKSTDEKPISDPKEPSPGTNQEQLPHVSEEAAATSKIQGESGPDLDQGTPVEEVLNRDPKAAEKAPNVLKNGARDPGSKPQTRSFSTSARRLSEMMQYAPESRPIARSGHTFELPELPLPEHSHLKSKYRTVDIIHQVTRLIMQDGKLAKAERDMSIILNHLRTSPPPAYDARHPVLPDAPPPQHLPLDPVAYLALALDSVAPLFRLRSQRGVLGGGATLQLPVPLAVRQRRRRAVTWILDAVDKKQSRGSGRTMFPTRVAEELIAIVEGRSSVWEKRSAVHRLGIAARSNLNRTRRR